MRLTIAERLKPFSHSPGTIVPVPKTKIGVQVYPALLRLYRLDDNNRSVIEEIPIPLSGPVKDFTVQCDLERGVVRIWGHYQEGFFRYRIEGLPKLTIVMEKTPGPVLEFTGDYSGVDVTPRERLSLGSHKKQDWDLVKRRSDLAEILPVWHRLGQVIPNDSSKSDKPSLLSMCEVAKNDRRDVVPALCNLFHAGFDGILTPRFGDTDHLGFSLPIGGPPLSLLTEGAMFIRSLFIEQDGSILRVLPYLPPEFHCGRMLGIQCYGLGTLDIEWSKKMIRRMVFQADETATICFAFSKDVVSYRLNKGDEIQSGQSIDVIKGETYLFDRFLK